MIHHNTVGKYFRFMPRLICWLIEPKLQFNVFFVLLRWRILREPLNRFYAGNLESARNCLLMIIGFDFMEIKRRLTRLKVFDFWMS